MKPADSHYERGTRGGQVNSSKAAYGFTSLADITTRPMAQGDNCPGYWWSEQMKYYYLMFAGPKRVDLNRLVLSTEANVLRGFVVA